MTEQAERDLELCGNGKATAMAFFRSDVWRYCVRKKGHDGECVLDLSQYQIERIRPLLKELSEVEALADKLRVELQEITKAEAAAEAARGQ